MRDLWQDYLTLLLQNPMRVRSVFVHNMKGVRLDGSNATIILDGEDNFQADRNKISTFGSIMVSGHYLHCCYI